MSDVPTLDTSLVLEGLDAEIARLTDERRAPGWTNWAVLAGIGTLLWGVAGLDRVQYSRALLQLLIAMSLALDVLLSTKSWLAPSIQNGPPRFRSSGILAPQRTYQVMYLARAIALIAAVRWLRGNWWATYVLPVTWAYGSRALLAFATILMSTKELPIGPLETPKALRTVDRWLPITVHVAAAIGTLYIGHAAFLDWRSGLFTPDDLRFAGAIVAIVYLTSKIVSDTSSPVVEALVTTRRDLAFGRIDSATAVNQADIALLGARFSEFLQKDVAEYVKLMEAARGEGSQVFQKVDSLLRTVPRAETYTEGQLALIHSVRDSCELHIQREKDLLRRMRTLSTEIFDRAALGPKEDREEITRKILSELDSFDAHIDLIIERLQTAQPLFAPPTRTSAEPSRTHSGPQAQG